MKKFIFVIALAAAWVPNSWAQADKPDHKLVVAMAHHLVTEQLGTMARASFGPTAIHPQPGGNYWAVVGELVSNAIKGKMSNHTYVAAVRLVCGEIEKPDCWRLEKMALDSRQVK